MTETYRDILANELEKRQKVNGYYSLRAYARDLNISSGRLSEVLNKNKGLSKKAALDIAVKLSLSKDESEKFVNLVIESDGRSRRDRLLATAKLNKHRSQYDKDHLLRLDLFKLISEWYHFAILELTVLKDFDSDPNWISKKLSITTHQATSAVNRLIKHGLLHKKGKRLVASTTKTHVNHDVPSEAIKSFHESLLQKAMISLRTDSVNKREFNTCILSMNEDYLDEAKNKLREFMKQFPEDMTCKPNKRALYCLGVQFFKLNK